ncbi:hypothetical protein H6P81_006534 [Aristolochia fimbriata]|uniref:At2g29880-like C-terminal domain-containing protein n=1 Tax=Aristolochia fimbriata TaxID=158543 RepID=A0AAV7EXK5_ARIFI|nr:hypothetical protein H6P81_006534 [Aristolochia fimbriata]
MLNSGSGNGWNANTKRVKPDDEVWDGYIKSHPDATKYREQGCDYFEQLQIVVGNSIATRSFAQGTMNVRKNSQQWLVALNEIHDLDPILKFMAPEFLNLHENKVAFIAMNQEERRTWLAWKALLMSDSESFEVQSLDTSLDDEKMMITATTGASIVAYNIIINKSGTAQSQAEQRLRAN